MKNRLVITLLSTLALSIPALAQSSQMLPPSPIEKELAARASDVAEVSMDKSMLAAAAKSMSSKDDAEERKMIEGLDSIYIHTFKFDKEGQVTNDDLEKLRQYYETSDWSPMINTRKEGKFVNIMVKKENGEVRGMLVLTSSDKKLAIIRIIGPIHMEDLDKLGSLGALGAMNGAHKADSKAKTK